MLRALDDFDTRRAPNPMIVILLLALVAILGLCIAANQIRISDTDCEVGEDEFGDFPNAPSINHERENRS